MKTSWKEKRREKCYDRSQATGDPEAGVCHARNNMVSEV